MSNCDHRSGQTSFLALLYTMRAYPWELVGLDLFNDDTHLSGFMSRPSHVGFSHICLSSTKRSDGVGWLRILLVANSFKSRVVLDIWPFISAVVYLKLKMLEFSWLDWICLTTHILQDILAVLHRWCLKSCFHSLNNDSSLIILSTSGGWLKLIDYIISDRRIPLFAGIPLCKSQELSRREHSTSQL